MIKAIWKGQTIAESEKTIVVEKNHYFPPEDVHTNLLTDSSLHTICSWKGEASYYNVVVDGIVNHNAAWYYPSTSEKAKNIESYISFSPMNGINILEE